MALPRQFTTACALLFTSCCILQSSWGHQHILTSTFIKKNTERKFLSSERNEHPCDEECNYSHLIYPTGMLRDAPSRSLILKTRGGSSYGDGYNDRYDYYRDDGGEDGKGYKNDGGYRDDGYDDRGQGYSYSPSYADGIERDRYYDDDYGGSGNGYYDDEGRYHEDYDERPGYSSSSNSPAVQRRKSKARLPTLTSSKRKLGIMFLSAGAAFTALGITLFFNKTLMRLGNLLFVAGVPLMIGPGRTVGYFLQPKKARATGCLGCGILMVLVGHPVIGILLEIFGLLNLFGNMFPLVTMMAKNLPVVGGLFGGNNGGNVGGGSSDKRRESRYDDDRYYEDKGYEQYRRDEIF